MRVSVIVPAYNRNDVLVKCVDGLYQQGLNEAFFEVIVVDDCSQIDSKIFLGDQLRVHQNLRVIRHESNRGLAAARNTGAFNANYEIILFLDSDIVPELGFLQAHLDLHSRFPDELIAGVSNLKYPNDIVAASNFVRFVNSRYLGNRDYSSQAKLNYEDLPAKNFGGGISSMQRSLFVALSGFDTKFIKYGGEDEEMGCRIKKAGTRIVFIESAKAIHYDTVNLSRFRLKMEEWSQNALPILVNKHPEYLSSTALGTIMIRELDSFPTCLLQLALKCIFSCSLLSFLEKMLSRTDGLKMFYFPKCYRLLIAGWIYNGRIASPVDARDGVWK